MPSRRYLDRALLIGAILASVPVSSTTVLAAPPAARWSSTTSFTPDIYTFANPSVAIDPAGDAIVAWFHEITRNQGPPYVLDPVVSSSSLAGQPWAVADTVPTSAHQSLSNYLGVTPIVQIDARGNSTVVYASDDGLWTADKPKGGVWSAARLLTGPVYGPYPYGYVLPVFRFKMNLSGAAVVAWGQEGIDGIYVAERPAGGQWVSPHRVSPVATNRWIQADDLAVSEDGSAVVAWETFVITDPLHHRGFDRYTLYTSGTRAVGGGWVQSKVLLGPDHAGYNGLLAVDASGHAGLLATRNDGRKVSLVEASPTASWSAPAPIASSRFVADNYTSPKSFAVDAVGNASVIGVDTVLNTPAVVSGNLRSNHWTGLVDLAPAGQAKGLRALDVGANGFAVAVWSTGFYSGQVFAATRADATAKWSAPSALSGKLYYAYQLSAAANGEGQAVVTWEQLKGSVAILQANSFAR